MTMMLMLLMTRAIMLDRVLIEDATFFISLCVSLPYSVSAATPEFDPSCLPSAGSSVVTHRVSGLVPVRKVLDNILLKHNAKSESMWRLSNHRTLTHLMDNRSR